MDLDVDASPAGQDAEASADDYTWQPPETRERRILRRLRELTTGTRASGADALTHHEATARVMDEELRRLRVEIETGSHKPARAAEGSRGHRRFAAWSRGFTIAELGRLLGIDPSYVSHLRGGRKMPSLALAARIERLTADWAEGPICVVEWVADEGSKR